MTERLSHPIHELLGQRTFRRDGVYDMDEFGFTSLVVERSRVTQTRSPGPPVPHDRVLPPAVAENLALRLTEIAALKGQAPAESWDKEV